MSDKFDYKKVYKSFYYPSDKRFSILEVPPLKFLMVDGKGDPNNNPAYQEVMNALYSMAYTIKFALKPQGVEFVVPPLEGLWWADDMSHFLNGNKAAWIWTMMIMMPDFVTNEVFQQSKVEAARKRNLPALGSMYLKTYTEGLAAQILYFGAYSDEGPTIAKMHQFIEAEGYTMNGKHHEIYMGDPRRTAPEKLKTVIRQPIKLR